MEQTRKLDTADVEKTAMRQTLIDVCSALVEKGYKPIDQIVGYLLSEDPTYVTSYANARAKIRSIDRDQLLHILVEGFLEGCP